jgi:hypothetical protein
MTIAPGRRCGLGLWALFGRVSKDSKLLTIR